MKKKLMRFVSLMMALAIFAGCGGTGSEESETSKSDQTEAVSSEATAGEEAKEGEYTEITVAFWDAEKALADKENDPLYLEFREKTGVDLVPQEISGSDYNEKILLWAASGQLPDIFVGDFSGLGQSTFYDWVNQGVIASLPEDLSAYPNLAEYMTMDRVEDSKQDGKVYMIPRQSYGELTQSALDRNVVYRWDLAQKAGIEKKPETWEEFREMVLAIIEADPEGKNIQGLYQKGAKTLAGYMYNYGGILEKKWILNDEGKAIPSYFDGDVKAVMNLARDMYDEGTIAKDVTQVLGDQALDAFLNGTSAALCFNNGPMDLYNMGRDWEALYGRNFLEDVGFLPLMPAADGQNWYFVDTEAWSETYISSQISEEKMDAVLRMFDYLVSDEGRLLMWCGLEGEDYTVGGDGKVEITLDEGQTLKDKYAFVGMSNLGVHNPAFWDMEFPSAILQEYRDENLARMEDAKANGVLPEIADEIMFISTPLKTSFLWDPHTDFSTIMTGTEPVDEMVDKRMGEYEASGLNEMLEEVNNFVKENDVLK